MRALLMAARVLFILALPGVLITGSIAGVANSQWFYERGFSKYQVSQVTGLPESELSKAAGAIISYFNSDQEHFDLTVTSMEGRSFPLFNEREVMHLEDVKGLIRLDYRVLAATLIIALAYLGVQIKRRDWSGLAKGAVVGSALTLVIMLALGVGSLLNFDQLWLQFHFFSFANELWRLDPARDYMIMMFPQGFFYEAALTIGGISTGVAVALGAVSWRSLRKATRGRVPGAGVR